MIMMSLTLSFFIAVIVAVIAVRLAPMFGGNSQCLEMLLSDESLADRYRPMGRLLQENDWTYLASQPGFSASQIRAIRSRRRLLFRKYLSCLSGDFASICLMIRALMVQSQVSRPDLAKALFRCQLTFAVSLLRVESALLSHAIGFRAIQVDVSGLLRMLEEIGGEVRGLRMSAELMAA